MKLKVYCINLKEETLKRERITELLKEEGLSGEVLMFDGVHYSEINEDFLRNNDLKIFDEWMIEDCGIRHYERNVRSGEIGCCVSHYFCWKAFLESGARYGLFFEDDCYWEETGIIKKTVEEFMSFNKDYKADLFYLSRIIPEMDNDEGTVSPEDAKEEAVTGDVGDQGAKGQKGQERDTDYNYVIPTYSYNLNAYVLSREGAAKILDQKPNHSIMTPDEIIPAMYFKDMHERHPNIARRFKPNLKALALNGPVLDGRFVGVCSQMHEGEMTPSTVDRSDEYVG
jgi:GR25 family glycosyltransferase involved in LPS biosynthesis